MISQNPERSSGYLDSSYLESLRPFGEPERLECCGGWLLRREITGTKDIDATNGYPLFCCENWEELTNDLAVRVAQFVSTTLVLDPFQPFTPDALGAKFDFVLPFKTHYVLDLKQPLEDQVSRHHRRYAKRSLRNLQIDLVSSPADFLDDWIGLYSNLVQRRSLSGVHALSRDSFRLQLQAPGVLLFRARSHGELLGAILWYRQGEVCYAHLSALSPAGYRTGAAYGLIWSALEFFLQHSSGEIRFVDLGGAAGVKPLEDGIVWFKRGWTQQTRIKYLVGLIGNPARYRALAEANGTLPSTYFPAYRDPSGRLQLGT